MNFFYFSVKPPGSCELHFTPALGKQSKYRKLLQEVSVSDKLFSKRAPEPVGPYPHARRVGDYIFVSGMGPRKPGTKEIPGVTLDASGNVTSHDIAVQTRSVIENIRMVLEDMDASLQDVVDVSVFLTHMKQDFQIFNQVYGEYFAGIGPTRTTVEVLSLPTPIAVELKVIAYKPLKS